MSLSVLLERIWPREILPTMRTFVRFLPSVGSHVNLQVEAVSESLWASFTVKGFVSSVYPGMSTQQALVGKRFAAV